MGQDPPTKELIIMFKREYIGEENDATFRHDEQTNASDSKGG